VTNEELTRLEELAKWLSECSPVEWPEATENICREAAEAIPALIAMVRERDASLSRLTGELVWYEERNTALVAETEALTARATRAEAEVERLKAEIDREKRVTEAALERLDLDAREEALNAARALEAKHEA
jgi:hypothetical protein